MGIRLGVQCIVFIVGSGSLRAFLEGLYAFPGTKKLPEYSSFTRLSDWGAITGVGLVGESRLACSVSGDGLV